MTDTTRPDCSICGHPFTDHLPTPNARGCCWAPCPCDNYIAPLEDRSHLFDAVDKGRHIGGDCERCDHPADQHPAIGRCDAYVYPNGDCTCRGYLAPAARDPFAKVELPDHPPTGDARRDAELLVDEQASAPTIEVRTTASTARCPRCGEIGRHSFFCPLRGMRRENVVLWPPHDPTILERAEADRRLLLAVDPADPDGRVVVAGAKNDEYVSPFRRIDVTDAFPEPTFFQDMMHKMLLEAAAREDAVLEPLWLRMVYGDRGAGFGIILWRAPLGGMPRAQLLTEAEDLRVRAGELTIIEAPWPSVGPGIRWPDVIAEWETPREFKYPDSFDDPDKRPQRRED